MKALTILNLDAGWYRSHPRQVERVRRPFSTLGPILLFGSSDWKAKLIQWSHEPQARALVVSGGDGTLSTVLSILDEHGGQRTPLVVPHPTGTMNSVARSLHITADPVRLAQTLGSVAATEGDLDRRFLYSVRIAGRLAFLTFWGELATAMASYERGRSKHPVAAVLRLFAESGTAMLGRGRRKVVGRVTHIDGKPVAAMAIRTMCAGTAPRGALGTRFFFRASGDDPLLHVWLISAGGKDLVRLAPYAWMARAPTNRSITECLVSRLRLEVPDSVLNLDGEVVECGGVLEIECGPRIEFAVPRGMFTKALGGSWSARGWWR